VSGFKSDEIAQAFLASCRDEIEAPKPGNVHIFAGGHAMEVQHFIASARVAAPAIAAAGERVGARIRNAVEATFAEVRMNTNLGIILLCGPLAHAAETKPGPELRNGLAETLANLDEQDAEDVYAAIRRAAPGGLGRAARYDVRETPLVSLLEAMREAADRDMIAKQYVTDFSDIFDIGVAAAADMRLLDDTHAVALGVYLTFLSRFPDTHIRRKHGEEVAAAVMREARVFVERVRREGGTARFLADLLAFDRRLKAARLNPGTSADFTVASLFAARLSGVLPLAEGRRADAAYEGSVKGGAQGWPPLRGCE
jgi:triphosphoribosyl-dephospho-CoA synthase